MNNLVNNYWRQIKTYLRVSGKRIVLYMVVTALMGWLVKFPIIWSPFYYLDCLIWGALIGFSLALINMMKVLRAQPDRLPTMQWCGLLYLPLFLSLFYSLISIEPTREDWHAFSWGLGIGAFFYLIYEVVDTRKWYKR